MAQSAPPTLDLPDPLEKPAETVANADDLISRLAGDEIDRMLAEAGGDAPASSPPSSPTPSEVAAAVPQAAEAAVPAEQKASVSAPPDEGTDIAAILDAAEKQAPAETSPAVSSPPAPAMPEAPQTTAAGPGPGAAALAAELAIDDLTRNVLAAGKLEVSPPSAPLPRASKPETSEVLPARRRSWLMPILEFINRPIANCSDTTIELLGKVAIITLFNGLALLVYVLVFKPK